MSGKKKNAQVVKEKEDDGAYRPFSGIRLKEKVTKLPSSSPSRKPVVVGYQKDADFGDILAAFEAGEDVSSVSKGDGRRHKTQDSRPFSEIFAEWEESQGLAPKKPKPKQVAIKKSSPYKQTRDFGAILSQFEGKSSKPETPKSVAKPKKKESPKKPMKESFVSSSGKSFGELLSQFEGKTTSRKEQEKAKEEKKEIEPLPEETKEPTREEQRKAKEEAQRAIHQKLTEDGVKWAGLGVEVMMTEVAHQEVVKKEPEEKPIVGKSNVIASGKSFGELLAQFESSPVVEMGPVETQASDSPFADLYKAWTDDHDEHDAIEQSKEEKRESSHKSYTIGQLRSMLPLVTRDMHGLTSEEAALETSRFLSDSYEHGVPKICIITGKGIHSQDGVPVVKEMVESVLHGSSYVREYASPKARYGGSGALWIILKEK